MGTGTTTLALAGDVMTGRGVDQVLPHPGSPALHERYVVDARDYVRLAERANGPVPTPVDFAWPWGDVLPLLDEWAPDARILNLETSVTTSDDFAPGKGVHYRMHPRNVPCLAAVAPDVCTLANNHVLDFGPDGLRETIDVLARAGLPTAGATAGAGDQDRALQPARVGPHGRVLVWSVADESSGVPASWAARRGRPGVALLPGLGAAQADRLAERVRREKRPGDLAVVSIHWGSNWGYDVPRAQIRFAHRLVDGGVDVVHGHSSHHPRPLEVYRDRLVLHGCGDLVNDYEGISGHDEFRGDLRLLHLVELDPATGRLQELRMVPLRAHRLRLRHATRTESAWLAGTLNDAGRRFGTHLAVESDGQLRLD